MALDKTSKLCLIVFAVIVGIALVIVLINRSSKPAAVPERYAQWMDDACRNNNMCKTADDIAKASAECLANRPAFENTACSEEDPEIREMACAEPCDATSFEADIPMGGATCKKFVTACVDINGGLANPKSSACMVDDKGNKKLVQVCAEY